MSIAKDFRKGILDCRPSAWMCRAVCLPLQSYLSVAEGIQTDLVEGVIIDENENEIEHTWLRLSSGKILDPTADQFKSPRGKRMPKIYIGPIPDWYLTEAKP